MRVKTSLSWLREYVDLPADLHRRATWSRRWSTSASRSSPIVDQAATVTGDLVVGRVLEIEELTGFKKPIRFCRVDVGDANGTGEPQEIVCGARNFAAGRPGRGDPARRRAARRLRHRRPQDVRAQLRTA